MPAEAKPLFHPAAVRAAKKETELLPKFIAHVFVGALGYAGAPADPHTLIERPA